jgi:hypothetical protein
MRGVDVGVHFVPDQKSLLDSYHTDDAKKCITPKEISKMMPTESSSQKTWQKQGQT